MTLALYPLVSYAALLPEILLLAAGCIVLLFRPADSNDRPPRAAWLTLLSLIGAILLLEFSPQLGLSLDSGSGLEFGRFSFFVRLSTLIVGVILTLVLWIQPDPREQNEFFSMMLFTLTGLMVLGSANDLVILFLALELVSIPTYVMVALSRQSAKSLEAGTKYFYLGAMAAAVTAYGFALLYGVCGTASLAGMQSRLTEILANPTGNPLAFAIASLGLLLSLGGLLFKVSAVPFHFYVADVYQGAASAVAGLLGFVPKLAGFAAMFKILSACGWQTMTGGTFWVLWWVAALSMTIGNILALRQTNIKRMLGFSGIAHSGYMLVGLLVGPHGQGMIGDGAAAVLYYTVVYGIANLGAFAVLSVLRVRGEPAETLRDVAGLLRRQPSLALLLALAMFTLLGMPPTPGFWGKVGLFGSALSTATATGGQTQAWLVALVLIGMVNTAIGAAYYLRVIAACLLYESDDPIDSVDRDAPRMGAVICGFLTLMFMFYPTALFEPGRAASSELLVIARSDVPAAETQGFETADTGGLITETSRLVKN